MSMIRGDWGDQGPQREAGALAINSAVLAQRWVDTLSCVALESGAELARVFAACGSLGRGAGA